MKENLIAKILPQALFVFAAIVIQANSATAEPAQTMSDQCVKRVSTVFASIPGDDGTFFSSSDVTISNIVSKSNPPDAKGNISLTVSANLSINTDLGSATGSVVVSDAPGGCYINQLTFRQ